MSMDKLRTALPELIGRTLKHIVVSEHEDERTQLFLYFDDGIYYEFYGGRLYGIRHLDVGDLMTSQVGDYIPTTGRLEILDAKRTMVIERQETPAPASPLVVHRKSWLKALAL